MPLAVMGLAPLLPATNAQREHRVRDLAVASQVTIWFLLNSATPYPPVVIF